MKLKMHQQLKSVNFFSNCHLILAVDHGFSLGPVEGLEDPIKFLDSINIKKIDGIIAHRGIIKYLNQDRYTGKIIMHITGGGLSPGLNKEKFLVATPKEALLYGACAVSVQINIGSHSELEQIETAGRILGEAKIVGLPVLGMIYDINRTMSTSYLVRMGIELGFDCIKVDPGMSPNDFKKIVDISPVPIVIAGGAKKNKESFLQEIQAYIASGVSGVSVGRNIFQDSEPDILINQISDYVHK